jgi:hypothetical protein
MQKGVNMAKLTAKKPDLKKTRFFQPQHKKRAKMEAVADFVAELPPTQFSASFFTLDALAHDYNFTCFGNQCDPRPKTTNKSN